MIKQCSLLLKIQCLEHLGINEALHSGDKKKRNNLLLMGFCYLLVGVMLAFYVMLTSYAMGVMGAGDLIPAYLLAMVSLITFVFTFLKAGSILFTMKNHEILFSLPIRPQTIVAARFLGMYAGNFLLSALVMLPGAVVYARMAGPGAGFYVMTVLGLLFVPSIPMSVAAILSAAILAVGAGMKHKNFVTVILTFLMTGGIIVLSFTAGRMDMTVLSDFSSAIAESVNKLYPPASLYGRAVTGSDWGAFFLFVVLSAAFFAAFTVFTAWKYNEICGALKNHATGEKFVMGAQRTQSPLRALYLKELKRFWSSSVYVTNAGVGYLLMLALGIAVFAAGGDKVEGLFQMKGFLGPLYPYALAFCCAVCPTTIASVSMEGKQWWIAQSLPVSSKTLFDSKILVNLTFSLPCTALAAALIGASGACRGAEVFWLALVALVYNVFLSVLGIFINARMPLLNWENEACVVKQSGAIFCGMLVGMGATLIPLVCMVFSMGRMDGLINGMTCVVLAGASGVMYRAVKRMDLREVG